jgi:cystathionine beta-lyase/cystathionine gamma-synthase
VAAAYLDRPEGRWLYSRLENPTVMAAEKKVAALEGAEAAACFASGMAAISAALLSVLRRRRAILSDALYGDHAAGREVLARFGGGARRACWSPRRAGRAANARPSSSRPPPTRRAAGGRAKVAAARRARGVTCPRRHLRHPGEPPRPGARGPGPQRKYLNGHCDHLAGALAGRRDLVEGAVRVRRSTGGNLDPAAAYDLIRGMKTLEVRVLRQNDTALHLARSLERHPKVARVLHPFLESHPDHALARRLLRGGGGVLSVSVRGGFEAVCRVHDALRLVARASSLGGVESLASIPVISSHRSAGDAELAAAGIDRGKVRVSVGLEDPEDLVQDLARALERA